MKLLDGETEWEPGDWCEGCQMHTEHQHYKTFPTSDGFTEERHTFGQEHDTRESALAAIFLAIGWKTIAQTGYDALAKEVNDRLENIEWSDWYRG